MAGEAAGANEATQRPGEPGSGDQTSDSRVPAAFSEEGIEYIQQLLSIEMRWEGPLPPPAALAAFEQIHPGMAERIVAMVEKEQAHRQSAQRTALRAEVASTLGGLVSGFVLAVLLILVSAYLILEGHDWAGSTLGSGTIVSLVAVFVARGRSHSEEKHRDGKRPKPKR